jgi:type I restriction enzyme, R subunit
VVWPGRSETTQSGLADLQAEISLRMEEIIRKHAVVRWRENPDAQNRMRNDMDDFLFELQSRRGIALTLEQMDSLIESGIAIARNRPHDV